MQNTISSAVMRPLNADQSARTTKTPREQLVTFEIEADNCPQVLLRVLGLMSRDGSIPVTVAMTRTTDMMFMTIELDGALTARCEQLRSRIEELPTVRHARLPLLGSLESNASDGAA